MTVFQVASRVVFSASAVSLSLYPALQVQEAQLAQLNLNAQASLELEQVPLTTCSSLLGGELEHASVVNAADTSASSVVHCQ